MIQLHSQAKVTQLDDAALRDEQIIRLYVLFITFLPFIYSVNHLEVMETAQS